MIPRPLWPGVDGRMLPLLLLEAEEILQTISVPGFVIHGGDYHAAHDDSIV